MRELEGSLDDFRSRVDDTDLYDSMKERLEENKIYDTSVVIEIVKK
ncbi:MAG: hypothetical protein ACP5GI_08050 [Sulfolobales archaeon]